MHDCRKIEERLTDLVFGELSEDQTARLLAEMDNSAPCRAEYQALKATLATFDKAADLMLPDETYWNAYEARLRVRLAADEPVSLWQRFAAFANAARLRPVWAVSVSALLIAALLFWFLFKPTGVPSERAKQTEAPAPSVTPAPEKDKQGPGNVAAPVSPVGETDGIAKAENRSGKNRSIGKRKFDLLAKTGANKQSDVARQTKQPELAPTVSMSEYDYLVRTLANDETAKHFEKAQNLLRAFRNLNSNAQASADEIADEKNRSRSLLLRNVLLRREAETRGNLPVEQVLSALEPLLIDIAHLPARAPHNEIRAIRERIQKKEMIAKLQVYSARPVIAEATVD